MNGLNGDERETVITMSDGDDLVHIWTAQRTVLTALRKKEQVIEVAQGFIGYTEWASFTVDKDQWNPATGVKRRSNMTEEQKQKSAEALRKYREEQNGLPD